MTAALLEGYTDEGIENQLVHDSYQSATDVFAHIKSLLLVSQLGEEDATKELTEFISSHPATDLAQSPVAKKTRSFAEGGAGSTFEEQTKPSRIYIDGAFDMIHSGHYNAVR